MVGYGEIFFVLGSAALLFGPKDVPRVARAAGRVAGRAVGTVVNLRARVESAAEGAALREVHRDLSDGFTQLHAIRDEIRTGISPLAPGPLAQRVLRQAREPGATPAGGEGGAAEPPWAGGAAAAAASQPWSGAASGGAGAPSDRPFPFLPISAAALGRLPKRRSGQAVTGADILEEAVAEEALGTQAARLVSMPGALDAAAAAYAAQRQPTQAEAPPKRERPDGQ